MKLEFSVFNGSSWDWYQIATETFVNTKVFDINSNTSGQLNINRLNNYPSNSSVFLRGDGSWAVPPINSGTVTSVGISGSTGLSVSNSPITSSGTINLTLGAELQALSAFAGSGLMTRTGSSTYVGRTLTAGTGISISNGNGVSGDPTINLSNTAVTSGTYSYPSSLTVNAQGQLTSITAGSTPITSLTLTGAVTGSGTSTIATTLNTTQTISSSLFNINWTDTVASSKQVIHSLLDSSPLASSNPQFVNTVQVGSGSSTWRSWNLYYVGGYASTPVGASFTLSYFHNTTTERFPLSILCTGTGAFDFSTILLGSLGVKGDIDLNSNKLLNLGTPTISTDGCNKAYADSLITAQLSALSNLSTTGMMARTAANTFATRTITAGTGISISNGNGVSGNPTISIGTIPIANLSGYPTDSSLYLNGAGSWINPFGNVSFSGNTISSTTGSNIQFGQPVWMSDLGFWLRSYSNTNNGMVYNSTLVGTEFRGFSGFTWRTGTSGATERMVLDSTGILKVNTLASLNAGPVTCNNDLTLATGTILRINSGVNISPSFSYGYLNSGGSTGTASGSNNYSIYAGSRIAATEFNAYSSRNIKNIHNRDDEIVEEVFDIFKKISFTKYSYKDPYTNGFGNYYGVIAEELQEVLPNHVIGNDEYIPNIISFFDVEKVKKGYILKNSDFDFTLLSNEELNIKLKLVGEDKDTGEDKDICVDSVIKDNTFFILKENIEKSDIDFFESKRVFVFGTYGHCPTVCKTRLADLAMVVLQNIVKRVESLENIIKELKVWRI